MNSPSDALKKISTGLVLALALNGTLMNYLTLGIHFPKPEHLEKFTAAARRIAEEARKLDVLIDTGAWLDSDSGGVVLLSFWETKDSADAARPILGPLVKAEPFSDWESRPPQQFFRIVRLV